MTYIADLTFFKYSRSRYGPTLAVGWLDPSESYPIGKAPLDFVNKLRSYLDPDKKNVINYTRGFHHNELGENTELKQYYEEALDKNETYTKGGNGEIHFFYQNTFYAAPVMIVEYIIKNGYLPPQPFIEAVMEGQIITSENLEDYSTLDPKYDSFKVYDKKQIETNLVNDVMAALERKDLLWRIWKLFNKPKVYDEEIKTVFIALDKEMKAGNPTNVIKGADMVLSAYPSFALFHVFKAIGLKDLGRTEEAKHYLKILLPEFRANGSRNYAEILFHLGEIAEKEEDLKLAEKYLQEAQSRVPNDEQINAKLRKIQSQI